MIFLTGTKCKIPFLYVIFNCKRKKWDKKCLETRSSWLNCALRDDEAVYLVSRGHYEAVAVGN